MTDSQKLDRILAKVNKIDSIENEITSLKNEIKEVEESLRGEMKEVEESLRGEIKEVEESLRGEMKEVEISLKSEIEEVRDGVNGIKIIMENEIRPNIQRIAEGHLDLSRNLHEVMKYKDEIEMLSINTKMLQSEMQEWKKIS